MKKGYFITAISSVLIMTFILSACQPTPKEPPVVGKGDANLQESIQKTAAIDKAPVIEEDWEYQKDYDSGHRLIVDAVLINSDVQKLPVLSIGPKMFESGDGIKRIVDIFCPNAMLLEQGGKFSKQQLEQAIMEAKEEIFNIESGLPPHPGTKEPVPEGDRERLIEGLNQAIEYYKQQLPTALDSLNEAGYQLIEVEDGSMQSNMISETGDSISCIDFVNWGPDNIGSTFMFESNSFDYQNAEIYEKLVTPESLIDDMEFMKAKEVADRYVKDMGIDYMSLNSVSKGKNSYSFYYTRTHNGLQETYVRGHKGTSVTGVDFAEVIYLWEPEYLYYEVQNGEIVKAYWRNPSEVISVDNENVQAKSWEEIQQIFKTQMDYLLTPEPISNGNESSVFLEKTEVHINRIELGLTKVLIKDSKDDSKLIPTWSFLGYDTSPPNPAEEGMNVGGEVCFVTINAIDGTVIDRGLMY